MSEKVYIVGDRFAKFIENNNIISINQIEKELFNGQLTHRSCEYLLGQGVSAERANNLLRMVKRTNNAQIKLCFNEIQKACKNLVHKENLANSMISLPQRLSDTHFIADVLIDDQCDEMKDHISGQHIPGMALVESCRQMFLAVTEEYFLKQDKCNAYFVINESRAEYLQFVFPLDIQIDYQILDSQLKESGNYRFNVVMEVMQNKQACARIHYVFTTYDAAFLNDREAKAAALAVEKITSERG
ncbi:AfsA-related hotdog domain-containing protein [Catenovulum sp. SX2]|uniref:AfsA-related hotdog domain-containing protein n=1 Tax=Catenovulum sp. SX2 TaxID=3398614 RepID=UPI003F86FFF2